MLRILRAFTWLRWRVLMNSFERHGARDVVERFSIAAEQLAPILAILVMVPSALLLAAAGVHAGWQLAEGNTEVLSFDLVRFVLLAGSLFVVIAPLMFPIGDRTNVVRLLLLPISRGTLYLGQASTALTDPWMLLIAAAALSVPAGLAAGGALAAAIVATTVALALLSLLAGVTLLVTSLIQLAVRDRRRGEIITVLLIAMLPILGMLPVLLDDTPRSSRGQRVGARSVSRAERLAIAVLPSELYVRSIRHAAAGSRDLSGLAALAGASAVLHVLAYGVFTRVLSAPATSGATGRHTRWGRRIPGVAAATSAVALAHLRLGLRTPRGRSSILSPALLFLVLAVVMLRGRGGRDLLFIPLDSGVMLASFTGIVALLSIVPLAMNQFAVDGPGFTMTLLAPVETRSVLAGKAIGNAFIAALPAGFCVAGAIVLFPSGHPALWMCVPLALVAIYLLVAPGAAALSTVFPRAVDMNSVGKSNAHSLAGLLGTLGLLAAGGPCLLLVFVAVRWLERPWLAPVFLLGWIAICAVVSTVLFGAAAALFDRRRENLAMVIRP